LARLVRHQGQRFESATWLHKARQMPKAEFQREVEKELTGKDSEPSELIYFKVYKSQIPVIEQAIETAALMLGSDKFLSPDQKLLIERLFLRQKKARCESAPSRGKEDRAATCSSERYIAAESPRCRRRLRLRRGSPHRSFPGSNPDLWLGESCGQIQFPAQSARLLPGLNGKFQTHCLGNGNQCGQARIAVRRQCSVKALTLDTSGLGHLGNTTPGFSYPAQGYQEHPRLLRVLQRRPQVFGGEVWVFAKLPSHRFVMRGAGLVFHGLRVLSL
jgi:hypothetical protein